MSTFDGIVNTLILEMGGFTQSIEQASYLTVSATSGDLSLTVAIGASFSPGVIEIEDELIYITAVDQASGVLTVAPFGRGYGGTTAAAHAVNAKVGNAPIFPRAVIKQRVNEAIDSVYPMLYATGTTTFLNIAGVSGYTMPAAATSVLYVVWYDTTTLEYVPVRRWRFDIQTQTIMVWDAIPPGRTVTVYYRKKPTRLSTASDDFTTVTGLPFSSEDVIRLGVMHRLLPLLEMTNSSSLTAEADFQAGSRSTAAAPLSRVMFAQYQNRLNEEAEKLAQLNPIRIHYSN